MDWKLKIELKRQQKYYHCWHTKSMLKKGVHFILHYCMKTRIVKWGSVSVMLSKDKDEISHTEWCVYVCVFVWWSGEGGRGIKDLCPYLYFLIMISRTAVLLLPSTCQSNGRCRREVLGLRRWSGEKGECEELWRWGGGGIVHGWWAVHGPLKVCTPKDGEGG